MAQKNLLKFVNDISDNEVWSLFAIISKELKKRGLVRTRNIVGERGEFLAIETYNNTPGMPNLQAAPEGTQNVDALSRKGERYSIKTISHPGKTTGVFYGCGDKNDSILSEKKFEYAIVVVIDGDFNLKNMYEITWQQFLSLRKWHSTMKAWNVSLTKNFCSNSKKII